MEEPWEVCITLDILVESSSVLCGRFERGKELKETSTFVVTSTTRTQELLCGVAEPRDKSLCPACLLLLRFMLSYLFLLVCLPTQLSP